MAAWRQKAIYLFEKALLINEVQSSLEVGCDDAGISRKLALKYPNIFFEGVDYRKDKIEQANQHKKKSNIANSRFVYEYFLDYKDNKNQYDIIIFTEVYEHLVAENQIFSLRLLGNLLSKEGFLIFTCPNGEYFLSHLRRSKTFSDRYEDNFFANMHQTDHWLEPSHAEIKKIFVSLGFNIVESGYFNLPKRHYKFIEKIESIFNKFPLLSKWLFKSQFILATKDPNSPLLNKINLF